MSSSSSREMQGDEAEEKRAGRSRPEEERNLGQRFVVAVRIVVVVSNLRRPRKEKERAPGQLRCFLRLSLCEPIEHPKHAAAYFAPDLTGQLGRAPRRTCRDRRLPHAGRGCPQESGRRHCSRDATASSRATASLNRTLRSGAPRHATAPWGDATSSSKESTDSGTGRARARPSAGLIKEEARVATPVLAPWPKQQPTAPSPDEGRGGEKVMM